MTNDSYQNYSRFYDEVEGIPNRSINFVRESILKFSSETKTILEIACGTGNVLSFFEKEYEVAGLDISLAMLNKANKRMPRVPFYHQSMADFKINKKFDLIYCVYDSINHLLKYDDWIKTFRSVSDHLNPGGLFLFDMNTLKKLDDIAASPPFTIEFNGNYLIMTITKGEENIFSWEVKIFEKTESELYKLNQDTVQEVSFPVEDVIASLEQQFDILEAKDSKGNKASDESNRIFFVCKKK